MCSAAHLLISTGGETESCCSSRITQQLTGATILPSFRPADPPLLRQRFQALSIVGIIMIDNHHGDNHGHYQNHDHHHHHHHPRPAARPQTKVFLLSAQGTTTKAACVTFCKSNLRKDEPSWASREQGCFLYFPSVLLHHIAQERTLGEKCPDTIWQICTAFFVSNFEHIFVI